MRRLILGLWPAFLVLAGCGDSLPPQTDPIKGREVLTSTLTKWSAGKSMNDVRGESPPVVVYDPDWEAGQKLILFELDRADGRSGVDLLVSVKLTLEGKSGK